MNNDTITSKTTIPTSSYIENIDCIYRQNDSTYCYFLASYTDPDTIGNCISIFSKTLNSEYIIDPLDLNFDGDNYSAPFYKRVLDNGGNYNDEYINGITLPFPLIMDLLIGGKIGKALIIGTKMKLILTVGLQLDFGMLTQIKKQ